MGSVPLLPSFLLMMVSGWVHRHQLIVIEYRQTENRLLQERLRGKRMRFTDAERALLARKAKAASDFLTVVRSIKDECLNRMIFVGQASLRQAVDEYMAHYHGERNRQGLENRLIRAPVVAAANDGAIHCHPRLGGTLNFYYRKAA